MAEIAIPSIGIAMTEALLVSWLKEPGDEVAAGEPVAEIETDKATMELESPVSGRLGAHLAEPGAIVPVGSVVVEVVAPGEAPALPRTEPAAPGPEATESRLHAPSPASASGRGEDGRRRPHTRSPRARRLAAERGAGAAPRADRFRQLIAAKVSQSWREIPHFAVTREVDAEPMLQTLAALRAAGIDPAPTFTDLLLRALATGLEATGREAGGQVGLAVATERGVVIPVIGGVLGLDAAGLTRARSAAVERARAGRLEPADLESTPPSTLSNLGAMGVDQFTGVIALGQTSLLTVGRAVPRVVADGDRALSVRTTFHATLNVDHRTIDGAEAARLLVAFTEAAETMTADF
jgi:pyruvate dehydrogenase E2 component (dihydrolipoyllysine-residue acetyltransferase)